MPAGKHIKIEDFNYNLSADRIAQIPLEKRDHSRLLIYKNEQISQDVFYNISDHLPQKSLLVLNDSRVIHARLLFPKESGAVIEIFCLAPDDGYLNNAFGKTGHCVWKCYVGNNKRWRSDVLSIKNSNVVLTARKLIYEEDIFKIQFTWEPCNLSFGDVLELFGKVPLPPYIKRHTIDSDDITYQTVFANKKGSVAAPTAGLHFTMKMLHDLKNKGISAQNLTLHVGAGTFKPVTSKTISGHEMHTEHIGVSKTLIKAIIKQLQDKEAIIPVGTTSARTLESLYWMGVKAVLKIDNIQHLDQWDPYELNAMGITADNALSALLEHMNSYNILRFEGYTRMIIVPGYDFKIANGIITNFHQPQSTLLLLVAALIGDKWKEAYQYAMDNDFRFLSYGDCCLFLNDKINNDTQRH